jgi:hypothetical protein
MRDVRQHVRHACRTDHADKERNRAMDKSFHLSSTSCFQVANVATIVDLSVGSSCLKRNTLHNRMAPDRETSGNPRQDDAVPARRELIWYRAQAQIYDNTEKYSASVLTQVSA